LINQYYVEFKKPVPQGKFLECLILILNAWKGKIGIDHLRENDNAKDALNLALEKGHSDIADILMSYGVQPHHKNCLTQAENGIKNNDLPMLEMLHRRQLFDFVQFRMEDGHTLLVLAITHNRTTALEFLQKIGVPNVIGKDGKSDSEAGHERFEAEREIFNKCVLAAILDIIRPCFVAHHLEWKSGIIAYMKPDFLFLLRLGIDLNIPLDDGKNTLLYHAVTEIFNSPAREYLTRILNHGANPHQAGISGITPLMEAERVYQEKQAERSEEDRLGALAIIQRMKEFPDSRFYRPF
jgi:ankyrin repeat protein